MYICFDDECINSQVRCVAGRQAADEAAEAGDMIRTRSRTLSRTYSNLSTSPKDGRADDVVAMAAEDGPGIDVIPPLPLNALMAADKDESGVLQQKDEGIVSLKYSCFSCFSLFSSNPTFVTMIHT